jgi:hypothetical protein
MSSISGNHLPLFQHCKQENNCDIYKLNVASLSNEECHMFFPVYPCEELLIATALEYITFHPNNKTMNDKFKIDLVKCGGIALFLCSFPKEFKDVCERAANLFEMTMKIMPRVMAEKGELKATALEFPAQSNILCFQGKRCNNPAIISEEHRNMQLFGNHLERLDID